MDVSSVEVANEIKDILSHYDIGDLVDFEKNERGFVNTSFAIDTLLAGKQQRYFLRQYKLGIQEEELIFEHSLINHLQEQHFDQAARLIKTKDGRTYFKRFRSQEDKNGVFCAIFEYLDGEDKYTWVGPRCNEKEISSSAVIQAQYHRAVYGFTPQGNRAEPGIYALLPAIADNYSSCPQRTKHTIFDSYLLEKSGLVLRNIAETRQALDAVDRSQLVELVVHCDYHPGNLKYQNDQAIGLFDFDWSKRDVRLFDVALALWYFFCSWEAGQDGKMRLDEARMYLEAYQRVLEGSRLEGLNAVELSLLPDMVSAANLYILNWTILDFYAKNVDPDEYLIYLQHSVRFIDWFKSQKSPWF